MKTTSLELAPQGARRDPCAVSSPFGRTLETPVMKAKIVLLAVGAMVAMTGMGLSAANAGACTDKCQKDWPRSIYHAVPRKACEAKCAAISMASSAKTTVTAAWDRSKAIGVAGVKKVKELGTAAVNKVKEVGTKVLNAIPLARGLWDKAKNCISDGLGSCVKKIVTAAGNLARGIYDKIKNCVADGLGGCLKRVAKAALELACKGVGIFWDKAKNCCAAKGAVQCVKDAAVEIVKRGAKYLCDRFATSLVPKLNQGAAWVLNKVGGALKSYKISLRGSEIGAMACMFKSQVGHTINDMSQKFGDPVLTIKDIVIGGVADGNAITAPLGATASLSVPGKPGALELRLEGEVDGTVDTKCNFEGPLATFGARVTKVGISSIPQWLTNSAVKNFVNPSLGCMAFCPKPIEAAGMPIKLDYCRVVDSCLKNKCTAPVVNTLLKQLFPVSMAVAPMLPNKESLNAVRGEVHGWNITIGGVKFIPGGKDPYRPAISASVSVGPPGRAKFNIQATGSLHVQTYCGGSGSMIKVTPSLALKIGDVPAWMQEISLPNMANNFIKEWANKNGGTAGRITVGYPAFLRSKSVAQGEKAGPNEVVPSIANHGPGLIEKLKTNWEALKGAISTALAGRFRGNAKACDSIAKPAAKKAAGGACKLCMNPNDQNMTPAAPGAGEVDDSTLAHVTSGTVNLRGGPGMTHKPIGVLKRCDEVQIVQSNVPGNQNFWTKVLFKGHAGYVAAQYLSRGRAHGCKAVAAK